MQELVVSKFGGTSMGDAECMLRSAEVSFKQHSKLIVVSATSGTTNNLIELGKTAETKSWDEASLLIEQIKTRHLRIANDLNLPKESYSTLEQLLEEMESMARGINLLKDCSLKAMDKMQSFGERMSSLLMTQAMNLILQKNNSPLSAKTLDARKVLITDGQYSKARPLTNEIEKKAQLELGQIKTDSYVYITQGFIGGTLDGMTTTLGRGGSDYSAALFANAVKATKLEIWTDVAGIATTDPRISNKARPIAEISFKEASELATFGAKILHPATLLPVINSEIPVFVGSSFGAQLGGTWIKKSVENAPLIRAMAIRKNQVLITLSTPEMLYAHGFLFQIFKVFNDHKVSVDAITTSEISVSMTLDNSALLNRDLISDLEKLAVVKVEDNLSLVSLIGNNINHTAGLGKKIFTALEGINVRMICSGASKHNFCFIVDGNHGEEAIKRLHETFIENN